MFCNILGLSPCDILMCVSDPKLESVFVDSGIVPETMSFAKCYQVPNNLLQLALSSKDTTLKIKSEVNYVLDKLEGLPRQCSDSILQARFDSLEVAIAEMDKCVSLVLNQLSLDAEYSKVVKHVMTSGEHSVGLTEEQNSLALRYKPRPNILEIVRDEQSIRLSYESAEKSVCVEGLRSSKTNGLLQSLLGVKDYLSSLNFDTLNGVESDRTYFSETLSHWCDVSNVAKLTMRFVDDRLAKADSMRKVSYLQDTKDLMSFLPKSGVVNENIDGVVYGYTDFASGLQLIGLDGSASKYKDDFRDLSRLAGSSKSTLRVLGLAYTIAARIEQMAEDEDLVADLEDLGLFFLNSVKTSFVLDDAKTLVVYDKSQVVLEDTKENISYKSMLGSICNLLENDLVACGARI